MSDDLLNCRPLLVLDHMGMDRYGEKWIPLFDPQIYAGFILDTSERDPRPHLITTENMKNTLLAHKKTTCVIGLNMAIPLVLEIFEEIIPRWNVRFEKPFPVVYHKTAIESVELDFKEAVVKARGEGSIRVVSFEHVGKDKVWATLCRMLNLVRGDSPPRHFLRNIAVAYLFRLDDFLSQEPVDGRLTKSFSAWLQERIDLDRIEKELSELRDGDRLAELLEYCDHATQEKLRAESEKLVQNIRIALPSNEFKVLEDLKKSVTHWANTLDATGEGYDS